MKVNVNKDKLVMAITVGIACLSLMLVMFMQFKVVKQTDITAIENMRESELRAELASWKEKYDEIYERYIEVTTKLSEYKNERESDEKTAELLQTELAQLNQFLGKTNLEGEGITIEIIDNYSDDSSDDVLIKKVTEENLLIIVNDLFAAGAEAISINDNRIIAMSDIFSIGSEGFLQVNGERIVSPYSIKVIGDSEYLSNSVIGKGTELSQLQELGHTVNVTKSRRITINKYNGTISTNYIK